MAKRAKKTYRSKHRFDDLSQYELVDAMLIYSSCSREALDTFGKSPNALSLKVNFNLKTTEEQPDRLQAIVAFSMGAAFGESESRPFIDATFRLIYRFPEPLRDDDEVMTRFQREYVAKHSWPYWRQHSRMIATAMGLPSVPVPAALPRDSREVSRGFVPQKPGQSTRSAGT